LYVQLDELDAEIARVQSSRAPDDVGLRAHAETAKEKAQQSAEEVKFVRARPQPTLLASPDLKQAYRRAVKLMHPDLAVTDHGQRRRTELMAAVNLAYERGDQGAIVRAMEEFGQDPEWIVGEDIGSRIVKAVRRNAQLRRRLDEIQREMNELCESEVFQLKQNTEEAEAKGGYPLSDLAYQLKQEIASRATRLAAMRENASEPGRL
jgi:hypothetical protein